LRKTVGIIALLLPIVLAGGAIVLALLGPHHALPYPLLERSISDYYHTPMRNVLVGSLCTIAAFLACSRGYDLNDEITGYLAGAFTLGVALFPPVTPHARYTAMDVNIGFVHTGFAALMFLALAYFCLFLFRKSSPAVTLTRRKRHRNQIYAACGLTIVVCMILMVAVTLTAWAESLRPSGLLFWCEALALAAFGVAWLTKGEGFLRDRPHNHVRPS
jgi:uncharacterized membrane protein